MLKTGLILAFASLCGFLANFVFSAVLDKLAYGELVAVFAIVSILALVAPLGTNAYSLTNPTHYQRHANATVVVPALIATTIGLAIFLKNTSLPYFALVTMLVASTLSVQGIMSCQINKNGPGAAVFQSIQSFIKIGAALIVFALFFTDLSHQNRHYALFLTLAALSALSIPLILKQLIDARRDGPLISLNFLKELDKKERKRLFSFWLSSNLGTAYSLGIIPLVAYFHGKEHAAYLGIYFIYWSGANILINIVINHHYWPRYCSAQSQELNARPLLVRSLVATVTASILVYCALTLTTLFFSERLWPEYAGLQTFLLITTCAVSIRILSAWLSMMILSFGDLIVRKTKVQFLILLAMLVAVPALNEPSYATIGWLVFSLETTYFLAYVLSSAKPLHKKLIKQK
ncbi:hypothetical protein [Aromatoleum aromaticum]|nr:hypothetical protein [Aromatoleum aromaticum]